MEQGDDEMFSLPPLWRGTAPWWSETTARAPSLPPSNKQGETETCGMDVEAFLSVNGDSGKQFACEEVFEASFGDARDVQFGFLAIFREEEEEKALVARIA